MEAGVMHCSVSSVPSEEDKSEYRLAVSWRLRSSPKKSSSSTEDALAVGLPSPPESDCGQPTLRDGRGRVRRKPARSSLRPPSTSLTDPTAPLPRTPLKQPRDEPISVPPLTLLEKQLTSINNTLLTAISASQTDGPADACPFPLQPIPPVIDITPPLGAGSEGERQAKRRCISVGGPPLTPPTTPDRFIATRTISHNLSNSFRVSKPADQLTKSEKLLRQNSVSPDPFRSPSIARQGRPRISTNRNNRRVSGQVPLISGTNLLQPSLDPLNPQTRQVSTGAVWRVGGTAATAPVAPIDAIVDGRGGLMGSGTNAPMYTSRFFERNTPDQDRGRLEGRLAAALDIDQTNRVLNHSQSPERSRGRKMVNGSSPSKPTQLEHRTDWKDGVWARGGSLPPARKPQSDEVRAVPTTPFRYVIKSRSKFVTLTSSTVLDAPQLRDDYYCSVLAYSYTSRTLAVGLSNKVYLWSEVSGVHYPELRRADRRNTYVTSLSFSSPAGGHSILAMGRNDGHLSLWSIHDEGIRFEIQLSTAIACLSFKPVTTRRRSTRFGSLVDIEELLVGDELGNVYYYCLEWMTEDQSAIHGWNGALNLMAKISVHTQQICGLAWSPDGEYFATGANDNACCLFNVKDVLTDQDSHDSSSSPSKGALGTLMAGFGLNGATRSIQGSFPTLLGQTSRRLHDSQSLSNSINLEANRLLASQPAYLEIEDGRQRHKWLHSAAIKAIAFCPWQRGLLATGGGSNDRAIHFYHTFSGACLATIDVQAQVTSLVWSTSRREIAATFGYAQPDHPYRIAVFSWPECRQVVAIPWASEMRALLAIAYPGGPNETSRQAGEGGVWWSRTAEEGCIVVASSDESVKFHEIWTGSKKSTGRSPGLLGGSDILESLEGIDKEGNEIIR